MQRKRGKELERAKVRVKHGNKYGEVILLGTHAFIIHDIDKQDKDLSKAKLTKDGGLDTVETASLEELEKAMERLERRIHDDERISTESTAKVMKRLDVVERDIIDIRSEIAHISKIRGDKQKMEEE